MTPSNLIVNLVILLVMSLLAALLPANAAAKLQPAKALGYALLRAECEPAILAEASRRIFETWKVGGDVSCGTLRVC